MLNLKLIVLFCSLNIMVCYPDRSRKRPGKPNLNDVSIQTSVFESDIEDPETTPGLYQGDIAIDGTMHKYLRVGLKWDTFQNRMWPNRTVPYIVSPLYAPEEQVIIMMAIRTISFMTCVKFVEWDRNVPDFLLVWPIKHPKGCWSYIGKTGGAQVVSLQPPDQKSTNCLGSEGRAIHELMHAIGIFHEQSRHDRDRFVKVHWDNIIKSFKSNFEKQSLKNTTYSFEYDFNSIMHYGQFYFSKEKGKPTLTPKVNGYEIGQRKKMSVTDCLKINDLYGCLDESEVMRKKYYAICKTFGL